jgi:hypothetical protein
VTIKSLRYLRGHSSQVVPAQTLPSCSIDRWQLRQNPTSHTVVYFVRPLLRRPFPLLPQVRDASYGTQQDGRNQHHVQPVLSHPNPFIYVCLPLLCDGEIPPPFVLCAPRCGPSRQGRFLRPLSSSLIVLCLGIQPFIGYRHQILLQENHYPILLK